MQLVLVSVDDRHDKRVFTFVWPPPQGVIWLGSGEDSELVLAHETVAARHAKLSVAGERVLIEDCSARGIEVGGVRVDGVATVGPDDVVRIGEVTLRVELRDPADDSSDETEQRFLALLHARPEDDETRSVYADWLEERGEGARADFLRSQLVARRSVSAEDVAFREASERIASLAPRVGIQWRARVAMSVIEGCDTPGRRVRLGFEVVCPMRWEQLEATSHEAVRHCRECKTDVLYCTSIEQARTHAQEGGCVAVDPAISRSPNAAYDLEREMFVGRPAPDISRLGKRS